MQLRVRQSTKPFFKAFITYIALFIFFALITSFSTFINFRFFHGQNILFSFLVNKFFNFFATNSISLYFAFRFLRKREILAKSVFSCAVLLILMTSYSVRAEVLTSITLNEIAQNKDYSSKTKETISASFKEAKSRELASLPLLAGYFFVSALFVILATSLEKKSIQDKSTSR